MTTPHKTDTARGWIFVEGLLAGDEARRVEALNGEELDAELRAIGIEPSAVPTAEELLAPRAPRAKGAEPATGDKKIDLARGMRWAERLPDDDAMLRDVARLEAQTPEEIDRELREAGSDPDAVPTAEELTGARVEEVQVPARAKSPPTAKVQPIPSLRVSWYRRRRMLILVAAVAIGVAAVSGAAASFLRGQPHKTAPSPLDRAKTLRDEAFAACDAQQWDACEAKLNEAVKLDWDGEHTDRVRDARLSIDLGRKAETQKLIGPK